MNENEDEKECEGESAKGRGGEGQRRRCFGLRGGRDCGEGGAEGSDQSAVRWSCWEKKAMATLIRKCDDLNEFLFYALFVCAALRPSAVPHSDCDGALIADVQSHMSLYSWRLDGASACHSTVGISQCKWLQLQAHEAIAQW